MRDADERPGEGDRPPTYTPWLVIRATPSDQGDRPLAADAVFWASPDIVLSPTDAWGRVNLGDQVTLTATVQNLGLAPATGTRATFWWADPSLELSPSTAKLIGTSDPVSIAAGQAAWLECTTPWRPEFVNGGHECLVVQLDRPGDPVAHPFRPDLDRRVAQCNVQVLAAGPQQMTLSLANPFGTEALTTLSIQSQWITGFDLAFAAELGLGTAHLLAQTDDAVLADRLARLGVRPEPAEPVGVRFGDISGDERIEPADDRTEEALRSRRGGEHRGIVVTETVLPPATRRFLTLDVDGDVGESTVLVHQIRQISDDVEVGGYTFVVPPQR